MQHSSDGGSQASQVDSEELFCPSCGHLHTPGADILVSKVWETMHADLRLIHRKLRTVLNNMDLSGFKAYDVQCLVVAEGILVDKMRLIVRSGLVSLVRKRRLAVSVAPAPDVAREPITEEGVSEGQLKSDMLAVQRVRANLGAAKRTARRQGRRKRQPARRVHKTEEA